MSAPNARFWVYENGAAVKLTLRDGAEPLSHDERGLTDEGWSASGETYWLDGDTVWREWWTDGRDCDGRMSSEGRNACHTSRLAAHRVGECRECHNTHTHSHHWRDIIAGDPWEAEPCRCGGVIDWTERYPDWTDDSRSQRDYSAEAAGY